MVISLFQAYFVSNFGYHSNGLIKMPEFYTSIILLINQLDEIGDKQLSGFYSRGGKICPLMQVSMQKKTFWNELVC